MNDIINEGLNMDSTEKPTIEDIGYADAIRQRTGLSDGEIMELTPMQRVKKIFAWYLGSDDWADTAKSYFESQGIYLTTDSEANGIIGDYDE